MNPLKQLRGGRAKALAEGTATPVAFGYWDDPELLVDGNSSVFQIWFNDVIDDWFGISAAMIVEALMLADGRDVLVHLNSPGGMVWEALSIHSTFKQYGGKVTMRVEGMVASAASFVMLAGDEVVIEPNACVMIHDAWDITVGPASEHRKTADLLDKVSDNIASMYATKSGTDAATWRAAMLEETWYIGQEAVDVGLCDSVVTDDTTAAENASGFASVKWDGLFAREPGRPTTSQAAASIVDDLREAPEPTSETTGQPAAVAAGTPATPLDWAAFHTALKEVTV